MDAMNPNNSNGRSGGRGRFDRGPGQTSVSALFERQPPQSPEAEMSLLGSMILDPAIIPDVIGLIKGPEDFYREAHGHIYKAVLDVYDQRHSGDLVQIVDLLRDRAVIDQIGGPEYLVELANAVPTAVNAPHFARIVAEKAKLRRLIDAAGQILYDAYHVGELGPEGAREVLDKAEMSVFEIAQEQNTADPQSLADLLQIEIDRILAADRDGWTMTGVRTGYSDLDELLRGLQPGELIILAARPSMGKTALALNLAEQIAMGGVPVAGAPATQAVPVGLFSLEMSKNAIVQRLLSARAGVSSQHLRGGHPISKHDLHQLGVAADDLKQAPIYIDDMPSLTILNLRARARRMVAQYGVKVIMIDYLQLMSAPGAARESRQVEVSAISRGVKALARELNVPVVCLSQLNRASEQREGNRPRMADLRESGSIEQDADVILLLHREDYYHVQDEDWKIENPDKVGVAEVIVAKQRNGPTDVVKLKWDSRTTRFKNFEANATPPGGYPFDDYSSPSQAAGNFGKAPAPEPKPWTRTAAPPPPFEPGSSFSGRSKTGPIEGHRDGGGSDQRPEFEEEEPS
jgi:replicative DNA helicase